MKEWALSPSRSVTQRREGFAGANSNSGWSQNKALYAAISLGFFPWNGQLAIPAMYELSKSSQYVLRYNPRISKRTKLRRNGNIYVHIGPCKTVMHDHVPISCHNTDLWPLQHATLHCCDICFLMRYLKSVFSHRRAASEHVCVRVIHLSCLQKRNMDGNVFLPKQRGCERRR